MKILFMVTRDWKNPGASGGDIQPWEYARYLAASGHSVTFLTSGFPGAPKEETVEGIEVVRLGRVLTLWFRTFVYYMRNLRGKFDVVVEEGFGGSRIPRLAPLYVKEPIVTEWHQVHAELFKAQYPGVMLPFLNLLERTVAWLHRNTLVRAGTLEWKDAFVGIGFKKENVFVVPVSIPEHMLEFPDAADVTEPTIVCLGKFRRYKCQDHAIRAMPAVLHEIPNARLILAGRRDDRGYEREMQRLVQELGIEPSVEFQFDLTEEEKKDLLRKCRAMVLPSSVEGFGIVVLEANACGLPVIASTGVPESVIHDGRNGLRYNYGEVGALAQAVVRLLRDEGLHTQLSANSLEFVKQFAWREVGAQYQEVVERAVQPEKTKVPV